MIGIKDTNDHLVSVTLLALADLVPILGSAIVIGGKRLKLFNDGRPNTTIALPRVTEKPLRRSSVLSTMNLSQNEERRSSAIETSLAYITQDLPERLSPDGGEDDILVNDNQHHIGAVEEDLDNWSDWDTEDNVTNETIANDNNPPNHFDNIDINVDTTAIQLSTISLNKKLESLPRKEIITDITQLDIKNIQNVNTNEMNEFNYFLDMEPVIEKTNKYFIDDSQVNSKMEIKDESKINLTMNITDDNVNEDCWGDDLSWAEN